MDRKAIIAALVAAVVFGAVGFGAGVLVGRSTATGRSGIAGRTGSAGGFGGFGGQNGQNGQNAQDRFSRAGMASGKVIEVAKDSFTVKMPDGSSRTVYVSASTQYSVNASATIADVSKDTTVTAIGTATSGGDMTAQRVQIGGGFGGGFRGPGGPDGAPQGGAQGGAPAAPAQ